MVDVGSGKGYLSSFLSLRYDLRVYGIDSSSINTHGAQERNRKLKRFSRVYQKRTKAAWTPAEATPSPLEETLNLKPNLNENDKASGSESREEEMPSIVCSGVDPAAEGRSELHPETEELFLSALSADAIEFRSPRVPPSQLSTDEKERRKRENLERKAQSQRDCSSAVFSPLTSYVTAETELRQLITELEVSLKR